MKSGVSVYGCVAAKEVAEREEPAIFTSSDVGYVGMGCSGQEGLQACGRDRLQHSGHQSMTMM